MTAVGFVLTWSPADENRPALMVQPVSTTTLLTSQGFREGALRALADRDYTLCSAERCEVSHNETVPDGEGAMFTQSQRCSACRPTLNAGRCFR